MSTRPSSIGVRTSNTTIAEACFEIVVPSTRRIEVTEIAIIQQAATAQSLSFGRPAAAGGSPTANLFQRLDPSDIASGTSGVIAWGGTKPTAPTIPMKRWNSAATVGVGIIWSWPPGRGPVINASATMTVHNVTTGVASDINATIEE